MIKDAKENIVDLKTGSQNVPFVMSGDIMVWGNTISKRLEVDPQYLFFNENNLCGNVQVFSNVKWSIF